MKFTFLPNSNREHELALLRSVFCAGFVLLLTQISVRVFLTGLTRQDIEEVLFPWPLFLGVLLLAFGVAALVHKKWLLGFASMLVGITSALIALLPILLHEGIRD